VRIDDRRTPPRVLFEPAIPLRAVAADGSWSRDCLLIEASDFDGQLSIIDPDVVHGEFFLMLSSFGLPAFRRCKRFWTRGDRIGVKFDKHQIGERLPNNLLVGQVFVAPNRD
jgi:hypothetical protein